MIAAFATVLLSIHENAILASQQLQHHLSLLQTWRNRWHLKANQYRCVLHLQRLPQITYPRSSWRRLSVHTKAEEKHLGRHLNQRRNMAKAHEDKWRQPNLILRQMHGLLGRKSSLTVDNKLLYRLVFKPVWTDGVQIWG